MKTKFKSRLLSILLVLVMVIALVPMSALTAFADSNSILSSASITVALPNAGETSVAGKFFESTEFNASIGWSTTQDGSDFNDFNNKTFEAGKTYYADIHLIANGDYEFADNTQITVNGQAYDAVWTVGSSYKEYVSVYDIPFTVLAEDNEEKAFTLLPSGATVGLNEFYAIQWEVNFVADQFKVLSYNVGSGNWDEIATPIYKEGINEYSVVSNTAKAQIYKIVAIKNGAPVLESSNFEVIWSDKYRVSFDANGGSGTMDAVFVAGDYMLPYCDFEAPEGYRFNRWRIDDTFYSQYSDIVVSRSIVVVPEWLPTVTCLPLEIDGTAIGGAKTPDAAKLKNYLNVSDQVYFCGGALCCGMQYESDTWYDAETKQPVTEFVDGKTYYYHIGVHPKSGYLLPEIRNEESDGAVASIKGIQWNSISTSVQSSDNYNKKCYEVDFFLKYDAEKGIPLEDRTEIDGIRIDGSELSGSKSPVGISEEKLQSDIFVICDENCEDIDDEILAVNNHWIDFNNGNVVNSFIDGHLYAFYLVMHLKDGYKMPESIPDDFVIIEGVKWDQQMVMSFGNSCVFVGAIIYNGEAGIPHSCTIKFVDEVEPSCTEDGYKAHYSCFCGKNFEDADGNTEITDLAAWGTIKSDGHKYGEEWNTDANNHYKECSCGDKANVSAHIDDNGDNKCDTCDYAMPAHNPDTPDQPDTPDTSEQPDNTDTSEQPDNTDIPNQPNDPDNPGTNPPADNPPSDDEGGLGTGAIIGIVCGSVAVVGIGGFALFWFVIKKKSFADLIAVFKK